VPPRIDSRVLGACRPRQSPPPSPKLVCGLTRCALGRPARVPLLALNHVQWTPNCIADLWSTGFTCSSSSTTWNDVPFELKPWLVWSQRKQHARRAFPWVGGAAPVPRAVGPKPACSPALQFSPVHFVRAHLVIRQVLENKRTTVPRALCLLHRRDLTRWSACCEGPTGAP
jgi:hypothetical protein